MHPKIQQLLGRLIDIAPPVVRERIVPWLRDRVAPAIRPAAWRTLKYVAAYAALQVIFSQSTTVQATWDGIKRYTPRSVHRVAGVIGRTPPGRLATSFTLAIRDGADWVFDPVHRLHARQEQKGKEAGQGIIEMKRAIDRAHDGIQRAPTVDELMQRVETAPPPP